MQPFYGIILIFFALLGCANTPTGEPDSAEYDRADKQNQVVDNYRRMRDACRRAGGWIIIDRRETVSGAPSLAELATARCVRGELP